LNKLRFVIESHDAFEPRWSRRRALGFVVVGAVALFGIFLFGNAVHQLAEHRPLWSVVYLAASVLLYGMALTVARWHYARR
jgi:hypothetical protein